MKIGIFGDSFANHLCDKNDTLAWFQILEKEFDITNHGQPGTSLYWSSTEFFKHHQNYNKIIFCVTAPGRIFLPEHSWFNRKFWPNNKVKHLHPLSVNNLLKEEPENLVIRAADAYYTHIENFQFCQYVDSLILNDLKSNRPDGLFLETVLKEIWNMENQHYNIDVRTLHDHYIDVRHCHMTRENNLIFSELIKKWVNNENFNFSVNDFVKPSDPFEQYFLKK